MERYTTRAAKDATASGYGGQGYADYIERHTLETAEYYRARGMHERADEILTRSLGAALIGNDGD